MLSPIPAAVRARGHRVSDQRLESIGPAALEPPWGASATQEPAAGTAGGAFRSSAQPATASSPVLADVSVALPPKGDSDLLCRAARKGAAAELGYPPRGRLLPRL